MPEDSQFPYGKPAFVFALVVAFAVVFLGIPVTVTIGRRGNVLWTLLVSAAVPLLGLGVGLLLRRWRGRVWRQLGLVCLLIGAGAIVVVVFLPGAWRGALLGTLIGAVAFLGSWIVSRRERAIADRRDRRGAA